MRFLGCVGQRDCNENLEAAGDKFASIHKQLYFRSFCALKNLSKSPLQTHVANQHGMIAQVFIHNIKLLHHKRGVG